VNRQALYRKGAATSTNSQFEILCPYTELGRATALLVVFLLLVSPIAAGQKKRAVQPRSQPASELAKLRADFIRATRDYKTSLEKLIASYQWSMEKAEARLVESKELFKQGLISKAQLQESETALAHANDKVNESRQQMATADAQIAAALVEAQAEAQFAKLRIRRGSLVSTTSYIRYNGATNWLLPETWKIQRFFFDTFKKPLPIAVFGQGAIHDRWRLDHRNALDISLYPDGVEGQALLNFLRSNGIPFLAFRAAIPGTATGPHIHIGRPSHKF
jgi:hypothetical protein